MNALELVLALGADDLTERDAAAAAVADLGTVVLPVLIGQLQDSGSPVSESVLLAVLRRMGTEAFEAVLGALQRRDRALWKPWRRSAARR
ncbi:hypothetical protein [Streptomyces sp. NPDC054952]